MGEANWWRRWRWRRNKLMLMVPLHFFVVMDCGNRITWAGLLPAQPEVLSRTFWHIKFLCIHIRIRRIPENLPWKLPSDVFQEAGKNYGFKWKMHFRFDDFREKTWAIFVCQITKFSHQFECQHHRNYLEIFLLNFRSRILWSGNNLLSLLKWSILVVWRKKSPKYCYTWE